MPPNQRGKKNYKKKIQISREFTLEKILNAKKKFERPFKLGGGKKSGKNFECSSVERADFHFLLRALPVAPWLGRGWDGGGFVLLSKERLAKYPTLSPRFGATERKENSFFCWGVRDWKAAAPTGPDFGICAGGKGEEGASSALHPHHQKLAGIASPPRHEPLLMPATLKINSCRSFPAVGHLLLLPRFSLPVIIIIICHFQYGA